jgi:hypothetical protein
MAGIDKIYLSQYNQYIEFKNWANKTRIPMKYGKPLPISNYIYDYWEEKDFCDNISRPVSNFPYCVDIFLIRNCPFDYIHKRLREQYGEDYDDILNYNSYYDKFERNGKGKDLRFNIVKKPTFYKKGWWRITVKVNDECWWYDEENDMFIGPYEQPCIYTSSCCDMKNLTLRKLTRKIIKKWDLPADATITAIGRYVGQTYIIKTR